MTFNFWLVSTFIDFSASHNYFSQKISCIDSKKVDFDKPNFVYEFTLQANEIELHDQLFNPFSTLADDISYLKVDKTSTYNTGNPADPY